MLQITTIFQLFVVAWMIGLLFDNPPIVSPVATPARALVPVARDIKMDVYGGSILLHLPGKQL